MSKLILHVGLHKTGSSNRQGLCRGSLQSEIGQINHSCPKQLITLDRPPV